MFFLAFDLVLFPLSASYILLDFHDIIHRRIPTRDSNASLLSLLLIYILLRTICKAIYSIIIYPTFLDPLRHLPQAPQTPLLSRFFSEPVGPDQERWLNTIPNNGLIRCHGRLNAPQVLITTPSGCDEVLVTKAAHFPKHNATRKILKMWLGTDTLLSSTSGEGHKTLRRRILPAFYARNIRELQPVYWRKAREMCDVLHDIVVYNNDRVLEVNLDDLIDRAAVDVVGLAGHGVDFNTLKEPGGEIGKLHKNAFDLGSKELQVVLSALLLPEWLFERLPFKVYRDNRAGVEALRAHCGAVIREDLVNRSTGEKSIVGMASQLGTFSEDDLVDMSMDLLVAGHKTVSSALQIAFYTIAQYPETQQRLREEIRANHESIQDVNLDKDLPYLNAVLNELMRLYPPVASMTRLSSRAVEVSGQLIPNGRDVVVSQWAMNRCTALWGDDAAVFRPERWLEEGPKPPLLTFSKGPRNCIGEGFARREVAVLMGALIGRFELSVVDGHDNDGERAERKIQPGITLRIKSGCRVGVKEVAS